MLREGIGRVSGAGVFTRLGAITKTTVNTYILILRRSFLAEFGRRALTKTLGRVRYDT